MEFDPYLYVALGVGWGLGRVVPAPEPWARHATFVTVVLLVGLLGATLRGVGVGALAAEIPWAAAFVALVLGLTLAAFVLLARGRTGASPPAGTVSLRAGTTSAGLLGALLVGFVVGGIGPLPTTLGVTLTLYLLLLLVGWTIRFDRAGLQRAWVPIAAATIGAFAASLAFYAWTRVALGASLAVGLAFGWYSLAGPLLSARAGAAIGLLGFLVNFLREILTMLLAPRLGARLGGPGLAALGGATAMDTTLPFVTRYGSSESASLALTTGLVLTLSAGLLLPALLAL